MENVSLCIFRYLTVYYIIKSFCSPSDLSQDTAVPYGTRLVLPHVPTILDYLNKSIKRTTKDLSKAKGKLAKISPVSNVELSVLSKTLNMPIECAHPTVVIVTTAHQNPSNIPRKNGVGKSSGFELCSCGWKNVRYVQHIVWESLNLIKLNENWKYEKFQEQRRLESLLNWCQSMRTRYRVIGVSIYFMWPM